MYLKFKVFERRGVIFQRRRTTNQRLLVFSFPFCILHSISKTVPVKLDGFCLMKSWALPKAPLSWRGSWAVRLARWTRVTQSLSQGRASEGAPRGTWHWVAFVCESACRFACGFFPSNVLK